jgi:hypothetical protein
MEESREKLVFYLSVSSSDRWTDIGHEQELGRFVKELSE